MRRPLLACVCLFSVGWLITQSWLIFSVTEVAAQDKSKSKAAKKKGSSSVLDVKANEIQGDFIKSAEGLANEYYELKEYDKARSLLKSIQALDPDRPNLIAKLKLLDENQISSNETEVEIKADEPWKTSGILVMGGKPIRIKAEGNYKFVMSTQLTTKGYSPPKNPTPMDMATDLPVGALIGLIHSVELPQGAPAVDNRVDKKKDDDKKEKPFLIGDGCEYTPQKDGVLFLRINAPPDNKNVGKIKVQVSGGVKAGK